MTHRCAVLDDYQSVALQMADWSKVASEVEVKVFNSGLGDSNAAARALQGFDIICAMRERTPFPRALLEKLPDLKLLVTTGARNASIDVAAAKERNIVVCGTGGFGHPTAELAVGLMIDLARKISFEHARMQAGEAWQKTIGIDLFGKTLGILGLGKLGTRVAKAGQAFGMKTIAWSQNLTAEKCREQGVDYVSKEELLKQSDFLTIHLQLSDRTRGLVGAEDFALMKPTAFLVNTSRGPIVDEKALLAALKDNRIAGAGLDVYDVEPLPTNHPFRKLSNVVLTPHLGYVTEGTYRVFYQDTVDDIRAFLDGKPTRVIA